MARRSRITGWHFAVMTAVSFVLAPAGDAAARKFQMSGTWVYRTGQVTWPEPLARAVAVAAGLGFST